jgi:hypothetical protein
VPIAGLQLEAAQDVDAVEVTIDDDGHAWLRFAGGGGGEVGQVGAPSWVRPAARAGEEQCPADETPLYAAELAEDGKTFQFRPRQPPGRTGWDKTRKLELKHAAFCPVVKAVYGEMRHEVLRAGRACDKADGAMATALDLGGATVCERVLGPKYVSWPVHSCGNTARKG